MEKDPRPKPEQSKRASLGRGLAALFGEEDQDYAALDELGAAKPVPVETLHPNRLQPRQDFDPEQLRDLAESIAANGILQPILVRPHAERPGEFEIVAGERRWRAAQIAELHQVLVVVRDFTDQRALAAAMVENVQRQDLSPIEEAEGYQRLLDDFGHTQDALALAVGKSRSYIANAVRLLGLPATVKGMVQRGALSAGHARALIGVPEAEALAKKIVARGLNVRQTERLVRRARGGRDPAADPGGALEAGRDLEPGRGTGGAGAGAAKDPDTLALERDLAALLGLKVSIEFTGQGGSLTVHYQTLEQLDDILRRLNQTPRYESE